MDDFFDNLKFWICIVVILLLLPIVLAPFVAFLEVIDIASIGEAIMKFIGGIYNSCYTHFLNMWEEVL